MSTSNTYDERQIIERGKAFQIGFMTAIVLPMITFFATGVLEIKIEPLTLFSIQTTVPIMICMMALILKNAYDPVNKRVAPILCGIFSAMGLYLIIFSAVRVYQGVDHFILNGVITNTTGFVIVGLAMVDTGIVYLIRRFKDKKELTEE